MSRSFKRSCIKARILKRDKRKSRNKRKLAKTSPINRFVLNLSNRLLTNHEYLLLSKGTKFIPTPSVKNIRNKIMGDFSELARKMRCKFHYNKLNKSEEIHPLYLQTGHISPVGNSALENYIFKTKFEISRLEVKKVRNNLSINERQALNNMIKDQQLYVSKADKNNTTVVLNKDEYIKVGTKHVNSMYYVPINKPNTMEIFNTIKNKANKLYSNGEIDRKTFEFFTSKCNPKHGQLYFLPKIHKIPVETLDKMKRDGLKYQDINIPSRPIINRSNSPTKRIGKFLDLILKPVLRRKPLYIQDTKDFIKRIESKIIINDCLLVTYDVNLLYLNVRLLFY